MFCDHTAIMLDASFHKKRLRYPLLDPVNATSFKLFWCQPSAIDFVRFLFLIFASKLFLSRKTHAVILISFFHIEYTLQSITLFPAAMHATVCFFLTFFSTSLRSGLKSSCGQSFIGLCRKSALFSICPIIHRPFFHDMRNVVDDVVLTENMSPLTWLCATLNLAHSA